MEEEEENRTPDFWIWSEHRVFSRDFEMPEVIAGAAQMPSVFVENREQI